MERSWSRRDMDSVVHRTTLGCGFYRSVEAEVKVKEDGFIVVKENNCSSFHWDDQDSSITVRTNISGGYLNRLEWKL